MINDADVAEDIVQDQFVYLWENKQRLASVASIKAYLFKSVKNKSINFLKKQYHSNAVGELDKNSVTEPFASIDLLEEAELISLLEKALEGLPVRYRTIFTMKRFGEMTNQEVASNLNISVKTVEAQMTIAMKKLGAYFSENWFLPILFLIGCTILFL